MAGNIIFPMLKLLVASPTILAMKQLIGLPTTVAFLVEHESIGFSPALDTPKTVILLLEL